MKRHPKLVMALCAAAVLLCAASPAAFLAFTDGARFGRVSPAAAPYTAAEPTGNDYYLLCQLGKRTSDHSGQTLQKLDYYLGGSSSIYEMTQSYQLREESIRILQDLADREILPQPWVDTAADWDDDTYTDYDGTVYWLDCPYYSLDSLGFLTITRFGVQDDSFYTVFSLTMDSRTGQVVSVWISAPEELEAPGTEALQAWVRLNGLDTLGDWAVPENTPYQNVLYSVRGQVLASSTVHSDFPLYNRPDFQRWYISLALNLMPPEKLPHNVPLVQ